MSGFGCGDDSGVPTDATMGDAPDMDSGPGMCSNDFECQDGIFCNGSEICAPGLGADERGCVAATADPCLEGQTCNEFEGRCVTDCDVSGDADRDGELAIDCGGADCNDADPRTFPGNTEICDLEFHDEDCDPETFGFRDQDMDGFPDARCCNLDPDDGSPICGTDCDDLVAIVHPTEAEACDGLDNDCDELVDEGATRTFWPDLDGDDFGDGAAAPVTSCAPPPDHVENDGDCDDTRATRNPSAPEVCDEVPDNDCDPTTNPHDVDGDGHDDEDCGGDDCNDDEATLYPGAPQLCDRIDNTCESGGGGFGGLPSRPIEDADADGYTSGEFCSGGPLLPGDCDDDAFHVRPGATEHCNGIDDDCDASTGEPADCTDPVVEDGFVLFSSTTPSFLDPIADAQVDDAGNIYVLIYAESGDLVGGSAASEGTYAVSFTPAGAVRWRELITTSQSRTQLAVTDDEAVVVGTFSDTATIDGTAYTAAGNADFFYARLNRNTGTVLASDTFGTARTDALCGVAAGPGNDLYLCLAAQDSPIQMPVGTITTTMFGAVARVRSTFEARWSVDIEQDPNSASARIASTTGRAYVLSAAHAFFSDPDLLSISSAGVVEWTEPVEGRIYGLAVDEAGDAYVGLAQFSTLESSRPGHARRYRSSGALVWDDVVVGARHIGGGDDALVVAAPRASWDHSQFPESSYGIRDGTQPTILVFGSDGVLRGHETINEGGAANVDISELRAAGDTAHVFARISSGSLDYGGVTATGRSAFYLRFTL